MDPDATLKEALEMLRELRTREDTCLPDELPAASARERTLAVGHLHDLITWLLKGGAPPNLDQVLNDLHFYD